MKRKIKSPPFRDTKIKEEMVDAVKEVSNFREIKLTKGKFKGKTAIFETEGKTVQICCQNCGYTDWQTFFIKVCGVRDIGRNCPECGSELWFDNEE